MRSVFLCHRRGSGVRARRRECRPPKAVKAKALKCPACGMALVTKKSAANPKAVKIGGKTYYCCSACKMEASAKGATKAGKGGKSAPATKSPS